MKRALLIITIAIFAFNRLAAQAIPNGGFENWNTTAWGDPAGYGTSNDQGVAKFPGFIPNVTQLPAWDHTSGNYAVQLKTEAINGDTVPGYITNSIDNPLNGKGGVPYSGKPSGIELWYNYSPATGDTAGMIVVFKKSGVIIGAYLLPITTPATNYPLLPFTFSPALLTSADTVIFAATSSINILQGKNGHAGTTFALSEVEFTSGTAQPADLNWNFSTWINDTAFAPQGWTASYPGTIRTTDKNSGTYALELETTLNAGGGSGADPAFATTGKFGPKDTSIIGGYPYTQTTDTLEYYYKYAPANGSTDSGSLALIFKNSGVPFFFEGQKLPAASNYTLNKLPISVPIVTPDSVIISFISSFADTGSIPLADVGSILKVDDMQFKSETTTGIKPLLLANNSILIYPNPASTQLTVASANDVINDVRLVNILGQTVLDKNYAVGFAADHQTIDVSTLPVGVYFISVTSGKATSTGKIVVNR